MTARALARVRNGLSHLSGYGRPALGVSAKDVVWSSGKVELWRYRSDRRRFRPPLLIVHSLVTRNSVLDLRPGNSLIEFMLDRGFDVFMVDWGAPDELDAHNDLGRYCDELLPELVSATTTVAGTPSVTLFGYCLGGLLCLLYAAGHPGDPISALAVMATPLDFSQLGAVGTLLDGDRIDMTTLLDGRGNVPAPMIRNLLRLLQPGVDVNGYANLLQHLDNDDFVTIHRALTRWAGDQVAFPGACFVEMAALARDHCFTKGRIPVGGREVYLGDITVPFLTVVAEHDQLVPPGATGDLCSLVGSSDHQEIRLAAGHVGLFLGASAQKRNLPAMADWFERHSQH